MGDERCINRVVPELFNPQSSFQFFISLSKIHPNTLSSNQITQETMKFTSFLKALTSIAVLATVVHADEIHSCGSDSDVRKLNQIVRSITGWNKGWTLIVTRH